MIALILNSGTGTRMGDLTANKPKCMTEILPGKTILSRQLKQLSSVGIKKAVITTGAFNDEIKKHCASLSLSMDYIFVNNPQYAETNYIYSIYLAEAFLDEDVLLLHGDLVFDDEVLMSAINNNESCLVVSSTLPLPEKDFKAVMENNNNMVNKVGIAYFDNALAAQPLYKLLKKDWQIWLARIVHFCQNGRVNCYAEDALNDITDKIVLYGLDIKNNLCMEVDTPEDLSLLSEKVAYE